MSTLFDLEEFPINQDSGMRESVKVTSKISEQIQSASARLVWPDHYHIATTVTEFEQIRDAVRRCGNLIFDVETSGLDPWHDKVYCVSIWAEDHAYLVPFEHQFMGRLANREAFRLILGPVFNDPSVKVSNHSVKFDAHFVREQLGIDVGWLHCDTLLAAWVLDCSKDSPHGLKEVAPKYMPYSTGSTDGNYGQQFGKKTAWSVIEPKLAAYYACKDVELVHYLLQGQAAAFDLKPKLKRLFWDYEMEVLNISFGAESIGMRVDENYLTNDLRPWTYEEYGKAVVALKPFIEPHLHLFTTGSGKKKIPATMVDVLESHAKLAEVFFNHLGIPLIKGVTEITEFKTVNGVKIPHVKRSLDKNAIAALKDKFECMRLLGNFRKIATLKKLFIDKLHRMVVNGRIHPTINVVGAATGRMSMENPNLQQIPSRMGPRVRNAFIAAEGMVYVSMDFSQQELRLMAHMSRDPKLLEIFALGKDLYSETAYELWGQEAVGSLETDEQKKASWHRGIAKILILGLGFGMGPKKFAKNCGLSDAEGIRLHKKYHETYPGVRLYQERAAKFARQHGYIVTMMGRERPLHFINSSEKGLQAKDERAAGNTPIQGSAADMTKRAAVNCQKLINKNNWPVRIALFVHDEIIFEMDAKWAKQYPENVALIKSTLETALPLSVPMVSSVQFEQRWGTEVREFDDLSDEMLEDMLEEAA